MAEVKLWHGQFRPLAQLSAPMRPGALYQGKVITMTNSNNTMAIISSSINLIGSTLADAPKTNNLYNILVWGAGVSGEEAARNVTLAEAIQVVRSVEAGPEALTCQVFSLAWGHGYITTWQEGGAAAKHFEGSDCYGFGGLVPEDATYMIKVINGDNTPITSKYDLAGTIQWVGQYIKETQAHVDKWHTSNGEIEDSGNAILDDTDRWAKEVLAIIATERCGEEAFIARLCELSFPDNGEEMNEVSHDLLLTMEKVDGTDFIKEWEDGKWATWRLAVGLGSGFRPYDAVEHLMDTDQWELLSKLPCPPDRGEDEWDGDATTYPRGLDGLQAAVRAARR